jgi:hypothetical protein
MRPRQPAQFFHQHLPLPLYPDDYSNTHPDAPWSSSASSAETLVETSTGDSSASGQAKDAEAPKLKLLASIDAMMGDIGEQTDGYVPRISLLETPFQR